MKKNYIYKTYLSKDDKIHTEKFPIIYENKNNIYIQDHSQVNDALRNLSDCGLVYETFTDFINCLLKKGYYSWKEASSSSVFIPSYVFTRVNPLLTEEEKKKLLYVDKVAKQKDKITSLKTRIALLNEELNGAVDELNRIIRDN